jgi:hypothetical protein
MGKRRIAFENESFDNILAQLLGGPYAKAGGNGAFNAIADGDDGVEIVVFYGTRHLPFPLLANY